MGEHGVTEQGFVLKRLDTILNELHGDLSEGFSSILKEKVDTRQNPQSFLNVITTTFGGRIADLWEVAQASYYAKYPPTAEGVNLDYAVQYAGIQRGKQKQSYYPVHCEGKDGTVIRKGVKIATNTAPQIYLSMKEESKIVRENCNSAVIKVAAALAGETYSVSINGIEYSYLSISDQSEDIINGLRNVIQNDEFVVEIEDGNLRIRDSIQERSDILVLSDNLTTDSVTTICTFITEQLGKITIPNGLITEIITVTPGLSGVTNLVQPTYGRLKEGDIELRHAYLAKSALRSSGMIESIIGHILNTVSGIESASGYENDSNETDKDGRPPHSIEIIVDGGNDVEIAQAILAKKAGGIQTYGNVVIPVNTRYGDVMDIRFNRPAGLYVWMKVKLYGKAELLPANFEKLTKKAILDKADTYTAGEPMLSQEFNYGIYSTVAGINYVDVKAAYSSDRNYVPEEDEYKYVNVAVTTRQKAVIKEERIEVVFGGSFSELDG